MELFGEIPVQIGGIKVGLTNWKKEDLLNLWFAVVVTEAVSQCSSYICLVYVHNTEQILFPFKYNKTGVMTM